MNYSPLVFLCLMCFANLVSARSVWVLKEVQLVEVKDEVLLMPNPAKDTIVGGRSAAHVFMLRGGFGLYTPMGMEVNKIGGTGLSFATSFQIGAFLDSRKTLSFSTAFFMSAGEFKEVHYPGARLFYSAYGFNTKWDYHWLQWPKGSLYSGAGVGFVREDFEYNANTTIPNPKSFEDGSNMSFQLDAVGIQLAPFKHLGLYAELGLGYEGAFKLGWQVHW